MNLVNQVFFFFLMIPDILKSEKKWAKKMKTLKSSWYIQYRVEFWLILMVKILLFIINWKAFFLIIFLPQGYGQWGIVGTNYWQHDGCDKEHLYNHSRNFLNPILNFFTFNNGYHGMHHNNPTLHWSLLPEVHKTEYEPFVHPNLNRTWLSAYLWEVCIYPGKRINFLGEPIQLPPKELDRDEDWVNQTHVDKNLKNLGASI